MSGFVKSWQQRSQNRGRGIGNLIRSPQPIKPQLDHATKEISLLVARLGQAEGRIKARDETIFRKVVIAMQKGDREHAAIFANELSEVRKVGATVAGAKLALEQVSMRIATITDLGEVAATLAPTIAVVKGVGAGLGTIVPGAQGELSEITSLLSETLVEAGSVGGTSLNFGPANEEADRVLSEAAAVASQRIETEFPKAPASVLRDEEREGLTA